MIVTQPYIDDRKGTEKFVVAAIKDHRCEHFRHHTLNQALATYDKLVKQGYRVASR